MIAMLPFSGYHFYIYKSEANSLHFVLRKAFLGAVIELGRSRTLVCRHFLRVLERAAVGEIGGDAGGAERVTPDRLGDTGCDCAAADHAPGIGLTHRLLGQHAPFVPASR